MRLTHVSLFTGAAGLDLAAEEAGFETVLQVEREPYALRILERHWPNVPRITDVREVHDDARWTQPTVVSGGVPCQPASTAGKRRGTSDDRWLWPEFMRVVQLLRPRYIVAENVSGLLSIDAGVAFENLLLEMERAGYEVLPLHYPAAGVGAPHRRDRVFILAHAERRRRGESSRDSDTERQPLYESIGEKSPLRIRSGSEAMANTSRLLRDGSGGTRRRRDEHSDCGETDGRDGPTQPRLGGMAHGLPTWLDGEPSGVPRVATGVPNRVARLKALGNAVVPAQAAPIFFAIAETERQRAEQEQGC